MITRKTPEQVDHMRKAGRLVGHTLSTLVEAVRPGVTLLELDAQAERVIRDGGGVPSFLGYHGFPATLCLSPNDWVVHGIPNGYVLADGDILSIDCGAIVEGWHGDAAVTVPVGRLDEAARAAAGAEPRGERGADAGGVHDAHDDAVRAAGRRAPPLSRPPIRVPAGCRARSKAALRRAPAGGWRGARGAGGPRARGATSSSGRGGA